jgi:hypothetical protein
MPLFNATKPCGPRFTAHDQEVLQIIDPPDTRCALQHHDLSGLADPEAGLTTLMAREAEGRFDLQRGPLFRAGLVVVGPHDHVLLLTGHHINLDGWSLGILSQELSAFYEAFSRGLPDPLDPLPLQYADWAVWQRRWKTKDVYREHAEYWRGVLAERPTPLIVPTDHDRPSKRDFSGHVTPLTFTPELMGRLKALGQGRGMTVYMIVLAAWSLMLSRLSGQNDLIIGTPTANRTYRELEGIVGFFVNLLAIRICLPGQLTVTDLLSRARTAVFGALAHQDLPFEQVVEAVTPLQRVAHPPLFQVMLAWQNIRSAPLRLGGLAVEEMPSPRPAAKFDLMLEMNDLGDRALGGLIYATALFRAETARQHLACLKLVLEQMLDNPLQAVADIDMTVRPKTFRP